MDGEHIWRLQYTPFSKEGVDENRAVDGSQSLPRPIITERPAIGQAKKKKAAKKVWLLSQFFIPSLHPAL